MEFQVRKASKFNSKARIALEGPAGSGKTYTALALAMSLGDRIVVIDTENATAALYSDEFPKEYDIIDNFPDNQYSPANYIKAVKFAENQGYDVIIIDSLSHAWAGQGGALEMADKAAARHHDNRFIGWRDVTPQQNAMVEVLTHSKAHIIITMRTKTEYVIETNEKGKTTPRKIGLAPIQRDGMDYEFDIVGQMDLEHNLIITKTRFTKFDGAVINRPGEEFAEAVKSWLMKGKPQTVDITASPEQPVLRPRTQRKKPAAAGSPDIISEDESVRLSQLFHNTYGWTKDMVLMLFADHSLGTSWKTLPAKSGDNDVIAWLESVAANQEMFEEYVARLK